MALNILAMKDPHVDMRVSKKDTFDLPMRMVVIGKSQLSGKSTLISNLLLRPWSSDDVGGQQFYKGDFKGEDIYIVCPSFDIDAKWAMIAKGKEIPDTNIWREYDEMALELWYNRISDQFERDVAEEKTPKHTLLVLDDCSFDGSLKAKMNGVLTRIACNGRHILISLICTSQKYSSVSTTIRENATGVIMFECSNKQLELFSEDHCNINKKRFEQMFRDTTREKHTFMVVNYSNSPDKRFQDSSFQPIKV
jgi:hypothetical protein